MSFNRRTVVKGGVTAAVGLGLGGPFEGVLARAVGPGGGRKIVAPPLAPTADLRDEINRLALPPGFHYRSFDPTGAAMTGGVVPGNHDGMGAFAGGGGNVVLIRNHERNGSLGPFTTGAPLYDDAAPGGNTRVIVVNHREVPAGLVVDEVLGFRRFAEREFTAEAPPTIIRCEHYLAGSFRRGSEAWPVLSLRTLVESPAFLHGTH